VESHGHSCALVGFRPGFGALHPFAERTSLYTAILSGDNDPGGTATAPGLATFTVTRSGQLKLRGWLRDGTPWTGSGLVSAGSEVPLYVSSIHGSIFGWLTLQPTETSDLHGDLFWIQPGLFTNRVAVLGARYVPPGRTGQVLAWTNAPALRMDGGLPAPLTNDVYIEGFTQFKVAPPNPDHLKLLLHAGNGLVEGSFVHPATGKPTSMKAVVLQKPGVVAGRFSAPGTNQNGVFLLGPAERISQLPGHR
jgi:hypothetical protein